MVGPMALNEDFVRSLPDNSPVVMVNLVRFRERSLDGNGSGWDAYQQAEELSPSGQPLCCRPDKDYDGAVPPDPDRTDITVCEHCRLARSSAAIVTKPEDAKRRGKWISSAFHVRCWNDNARAICRCERRRHALP